jgi:hypothetical protein
MLCGSCFGAVTWASWMQHVISVVIGKNLKTSWTEAMSRYALAYRWAAAHAVSYAIEFFCLSVAKLMVLDRMSSFASSQQIGIAQTRWDTGGRIVAAVVSVGNAIGFAGNIASAVQLKQASDSFQLASDYDAINKTVDGLKSFQVAIKQLESGAKLYTLQAFCEVAVLLVIVISFTIVGVACSNRIKTTLVAVRKIGAKYLRSHQASLVFAQAEVEGMQLRMQILVATGFVFAAFLLRSVFAVMRAVAYQLQDLGNSCPTAHSLCDSTCYNDYTHFSQWMYRTPEFQLTIVLLSSPVTLLVAIRGMTNKVITQRELYSEQMSITSQSKPGS